MISPDSVLEISPQVLLRTAEGARALTGEQKLAVVMVSGRLEAACRRIHLEEEETEAARLHHMCSRALRHVSAAVVPKGSQTPQCLVHLGVVLLLSPLHKVTQRSTATGQNTPMM